MSRLRIAVDAGGGDAGVATMVDGALTVVDEVDLLLVGPLRQIHDAAGPLPRGVEVLDAAVIGMAEDPVVAGWAKRDSSVHRAARAVAQGRADAMVTAGNGGAVMLAATALLRRLPSVRTPTLATLMRTAGAGETVLLDCGATTYASAETLAQFAVLGIGYARARLGVARPRVGLLSNGREDVKGGPVQRDAHRLLAALPGYVGQVECYDIIGDHVDVVVCDGFTGDVVLKMYEGTLEATLAVAARSAVRLGLDADGARWMSGAVWSTLAPEGGAVLLGLRGVCVKCHGLAPAYDIAAAIQMAARCIRAGVVACTAAELLDVSTMAAAR